MIENFLKVMLSMSGQVLELLIFAGIAFFIINKLISNLGKTSDDDPAKNSFFGENMSGNLKDVTFTGTNTSAKFTPKFLRSTAPDLKGLVLTENKDSVEKNLKELLKKYPSFNIERFLNSAKSAFKMIIEAGFENKTEQLMELVDKRYIDNFKTIASGYGEVEKNLEKLSSQISEIYMFGNNAFIKVLFSGKNITRKIKELHEEWTFSKNILSTDAAWYLTNVDKLGGH